MIRKTILYLILLAAGAAFAAESTQLQARLVSQHFSRELDLRSQDIELTILHAPEIPQPLLQAGKISVQPGRKQANLGHQTLWLLHKEGAVIKKRWPITVEVYANLYLPVASKNISRLDIVRPEDIQIRKQRVGREYQRLVTSKQDLIGKMACQMIREGRNFEQNMVKAAPDVNLGDELLIVLMNKGLALELPGIAKEEAQVGELVRVQCPTTRKEFQGILQSPQQVLVSLR